MEVFYSMVNGSESSNSNGCDRCEVVKCSVTPFMTYYVTYYVSL